MPFLAAKAIEKLVKDQDFRAAIIKGQRERLKDFDNQNLGVELLQIVKEVSCYV